MSWALADWQVELLRRGGLAISPTAGALAVAELEATYRELLRDAFTTAEVAKLLRLPESEVRQRREDRALWAIQSSNDWRFPRLQFIVNGPRREQLRGLDQVFPTLPGSLHPLSVAGFLTTPQPGLIQLDQPVTPMEWLSTGGDPQLVRDAAQAVQWTGL